MRHWPRDQSCLVQKSLRANTRGEDVSGLARNDRMCSSQERRELPRRLSRITMEITTSLGSHTVVARFLRRLFRFHLRYHTIPMMCVPSYSLLFRRPFACVRRWKVAHVRADTWESERYISALVWFSFLEPRDLYASHFSLNSFLNHFSGTFVPSARKSLRYIV